MSFERGPVSEWYRNGPRGLEQGFTLRRRLHRTGGTLTLELGVSGSLTPRSSGSQILFSDRAGTARLRYGDLRAADASGRPLPTRLELRGATIALHVDDRAAGYPLRIDPLIEQGSTSLTPRDQGAHGAFGHSVALSADGAIALIGGPSDGNGVGAAWVFTHSSNWWVQRVGKLTPSDASGSSGFGSSVALAAAGTTALIGGPSDDNGAGAAWVFTRLGESRAQRGSKLSPSDASGSARFGSSLALSAHGTTALIGGPSDGNGAGAVWVFTRTGGIWRQQGPKLTVGGESGGFGASVALSGDGASALIGAPGEHMGTGAAWVLARSGDAWTQRGAKLIGSDTRSDSMFGSSVALSANGATALVGGPNDGTGGAAWIFARSGNEWSQRAKLTTNRATRGGHFGQSVGLSSHGSTALIGGPSDHGGGAAWAFTRAGTSWTRQGAELTPGDGGHSFGFGVAVSADATTALVGGPHDNGDAGVAWAIQTRTLAATPSCFGAAARDPLHPCDNPRLAHTVIPTPSEAQITPSAACTIIAGSPIINACAFGVPAASAVRTVALLGDSHAIHWRAALEVVARAKSWAAVSIVRSGCPFTEASSGLPEPLRSQCAQRNRAVPGWLAQHPDIDTVFTAEHAAGDVVVPKRHDVFAAEIAGYINAWKALPRSVRHIIVIRDNPQVTANTLACVQQAMATHQRADLACAESRSAGLGQDPAAVAAMQLRSPRVQLIDLTPFFCDSRVCFPVVGGVLVYRDPNHLTAAFATTLGPFLVRDIDRLMASWGRRPPHQPRSAGVVDPAPRHALACSFHPCSS